MELTSHLSDDPDNVPVWFLLRDNETILVYSQPAKTNCATSAALYCEALIITPRRLYA